MLISEQTIEAAFDWLKINSGPAAAAKAERIRAEYNTKQTKGRLYLQSEESSVAARDAWALNHPDFAAAVEREAQAVEADEFHRNQRSKAEAIIDAWRTQSSNERVLAKVA